MSDISEKDIKSLIETKILFEMGREISGWSVLKDHKHIRPLTGIQ